MNSEADGDGYGVHWAFDGQGNTLEGLNNGDGRCNLCMPNGDRFDESKPSSSVTGDGP